ncbi:MAG: chemotaxis protein CheY [Nitrospira bacterium SG8_35_4]|nr:MAG: chemotaxis protein CheY [Nitrospira bacterium SG8_35_4]
MKILIVEDDFTNRKIMQKILSDYGDCDMAFDGNEAIEAFQQSLEEKKPYDLICMDIMMPNMDGQEALTRIRQLEKKSGIATRNEVKVIMTTALDDPKNVVNSLKSGAASYIVKPISKQKLVDEISKLGLFVSTGA